MRRSGSGRCRSRPGDRAHGAVALRRRLSRVAALSGVAAAAGVLLLAAGVFSAHSARAAEVTVFSGDVSLPNGHTVASGDTVRFDPNRDTTVEVTGNFVVEGTLEMRPVDGVTHILRFVGVDESTFVGGGHIVLESDPGLWVTGSGKLDLIGEPKTGWNRTGDDPTWDASDELLVAPTASGDFGKGGFDAFQLGGPVPRAHPAVPPAEVINLTRSVRIEGTPTGRSHVTILSANPQVVRYVAFRYMGPRQDSEFHAGLGRFITKGVLGRYPLHFHHVGDGSRGSLVEGNVIHDSGNHAVVVHGSHGVLVEDNVAYNVFDTAYWWDPFDATREVTYSHNFAGLVKIDPPFRGFRNAGFRMSSGSGNVARDNVAVAVQGSVDCSGYHWPENEGGIWVFENNVAHNNNCSGIFVWQNNSLQHEIDGFVSYRNGLYGIEHGAYKNAYQYRNLTLVGNGRAGIQVHTFSTGQLDPQVHQEFRCVAVIDNPVAVQIALSIAADGLPTPFINLVTSGTPVLVEIADNALAAGQTLDRRADFVDTGVPCGNGTFDDDDGSLHEPAIEILFARGITSGCDVRRFCPSEAVTRGQMAAFLRRALGLGPADGDYFTDDDSSIFEDDINRLASAGITSGCNPPRNDRYCPDDAVTRAQMAAFLVRALGLS